MFRQRWAAFLEWWSTASASVITHRRLKWLWIFPGIPISILLRQSIAYLVFLSVYAIIVGHWSSEEAAIGAEKIEENVTQAIEDDAQES